MMRSLCFHSKTPSFVATSSPSSSPSASAPRLRGLSQSRIDRIIETASSVITKWKPDTSSYAKVTSLFYESKTEAMQFIQRVNDLQKAMQLLASSSSEDSNSSTQQHDHRLVEAQSLMQIAMKRLQKEFYQILSINRAHLDPESVSARSSRASVTRSSTSEDEDEGSDEIRPAGDSISEVEEVSAAAMADLRSIAECMIASGYAKECISIYKVIRKSIIDEGIYRLGVERFSSSRVNKMDWEALEIRIKNWLEALKIAIKTLFTGERILCDHVFASSASIAESCFGDISREAAALLFRFPEQVAKSKRSSDRIFRVLDMYTAISENLAQIESIFSFDSISTIRSQALTSLARLAESARAMLSDFESTLQKDSSKIVVPGGGVHPLTSYAADYLALLGRYSNVLSEILAGWPPPPRSTLPESYFDGPESDDAPAPAISVRFAWLVLVLLCKLDSKAEYYKDVSVSYLFLANNLQHVVSKVRASNLQYFLGQDWIARHEEKVRQFAGSYGRLAWGHVCSSLPENPTDAISPEIAKERFRRFNSCFEEVYRKQSVCFVPDQKLRDEIKVSIARKLTSVYGEFYENHRLTIGGERDVRLFVRYTPEDVGNYLSDLFLGIGDPGSSSSS